MLVLIQLLTMNNEFSDRFPLLYLYTSMELGNISNIRNIVQILYYHVRILKFVLTTRLLVLYLRKVCPLICQNIWGHTLSEYRYPGLWTNYIDLITK